MTTNKPWNVSKTILSKIYSDPRSSHLCAFPSVEERAKFISTISDFTNSGVDVNVVASDDHTKGFTFGDLLTLQRNACSSAAHTMLRNMGKDGFLSSATEKGVCEIDLSEPHPTKDDVMNALQTTKPSLNEQEQNKYKSWKP